MISGLYICNRVFVLDPHEVWESTFSIFKRGAMESFKLLMWCDHVNLESNVTPKIFIVLFSLIFLLAHVYEEWCVIMLFSEHYALGFLRWEVEASIEIS